MWCKIKEPTVLQRKSCVVLEAIRLVTYFKYLCQLHLLVVKDCMNTMNSLFGLVRSSTLGLLMQDRNQSSNVNTKKNMLEILSSSRC